MSCLLNQGSYFKEGFQSISHRRSDCFSLEFELPGDTWRLSSTLAHHSSSNQTGGFPANTSKKCQSVWCILPQAADNSISSVGKKKKNQWVQGRCISALEAVQSMADGTMFCCILQAEDKPSESLLMQRHYCLQKEKKSFVYIDTVQIHGGPYSDHGRAELNSCTLSPVRGGKDLTRRNLQRMIEGGDVGFTTRNDGELLLLVRWQRLRNV